MNLTEIHIDLKKLNFFRDQSMGRYEKPQNRDFGYGHFSLDGIMLEMTTNHDYPKKGL